MSFFNEPPSVQQGLPSPAPTAAVIDTRTVYESEEFGRAYTVLEGSPWEVTLYNQVLGPDDAPMQLDLSIDPSLQSYHKIKSYLIMVTDELEHTTDPETRITEAVGGGQVYPGVAINNFDMVTARMQGGRTGLFIMKLSERHSYYGPTAWDVTYELYDFLSDAQLANLESKVVDTFVFDQARVGCSDVLLSEAEADKQFSIRLTQLRLYQWYCDEFMDHLTGTFLYEPKDHGTRVYDPQCVEFMTKLIGSKLRDGRTPAIRYATPNGQDRRRFRTVFDTLMDGEYYSLRRIYRTMRYVNTTAFRSPGVYYNIANTPIEEVLYPQDEPVLRSGVSKPAEGTYVFSQAFYQGDLENQTTIEQIVTRVLQGERPPIIEISECLDKVETMPKHELYYTIPVLLWLLVKMDGVASL